MRSKRSDSHHYENWVIKWQETKLEKREEHQKKNEKKIYYTSHDRRQKMGNSMTSSRVMFLQFHKLEATTHLLR